MLNKEFLRVHTAKIFNFSVFEYLHHKKAGKKYLPSMNLQLIYYVLSSSL